MRMKLGGGIGVVAAMVASACAAGAADLAPVYTKAPPPAYLSDWAGFYIGVHGGYGWGDTKFGDPFTFQNTLGAINTKPKGGLFGGHAGYNWQRGKVVAGIEVDVDDASIKSTDSLAEVAAAPSPGASQTVKFDALATARGRLGYVLLPDLLAYGTAGVALAHSTMDITVPSLGGSFTAFDYHFGLAAGAGLEYHLGQGFLVRGEYLHYDFQRNEYQVVAGGFAPITTTTTIDVFRGGLSYKF